VVTILNESLRFLQRLVLGFQIVSDVFLKSSKMSEISETGVTYHYFRFGNALIIHLIVHGGHFQGMDCEFETKRDRN
jgi:hypothetical protein